MPTFYPGVLSLAQAQPITVARGATVAGIDVQLIDGQPSSVSGTVVDGSGQPIAIGGSVIVRPIVKELAAIGIGMPSGTGLNPDRTFQLMLSPGEYELEAHASLTRANGSPAPGSELFGSVRVNIGGPVTGISISLGLAATSRAGSFSRAPRPHLRSRW